MTNDLQSITHKNNKDEQQEPTKFREWTRVLRKGKQFLLHMAQSSSPMAILYKPTANIELWRRY